MISVLHYGSGNIGAITNLLRLSNLPHEVIEQPSEIHRADRILLPGVGAFDPTMALFHQSGIEQALRERVAAGAALLGICVGMQVLGTASEEGTSPGLDFIPGKVKRFNEQAISLASKVPHMGWNTIKLRQPDHPMLKGIDAAKGFYFLHSYYFDCDSPASVLAEAEHGIGFHCMAGKGRVFGIQFHPEKSHQNGIQIFRNFMDV
jgi:imidazole glycerol-phosphate synthase subunit HisH